MHHKFENFSYTWRNIQLSEKIQQAFWRQRQSLRDFIEIWNGVSLKLILKEKGGKQHFTILFILT